MSQAFAFLWPFDGLVAAIVVVKAANRSLACKRIGILALASPTADAVAYLQRQHSKKNSVLITDDNRG